jgi:hypothetical protein
VPLIQLNSMKEKNEDKAELIEENLQKFKNIVMILMKSLYKERMKNGKQSKFYNLI